MRGPARCDLERAQREVAFPHARGGIRHRPCHLSCCGRSTASARGKRGVSHVRTGRAGHVLAELHEHRARARDPRSACSPIAGGVARELLLPLGSGARSPREDDHAFATPGLGVTMADGGERIDERKPAPPEGPLRARSEGPTPVRCPFLREEQVKSCQAAPFRKSLARSSATGEGERCTSADHATCPAACARATRRTPTPRAARSCASRSSSSARRRPGRPTCRGASRRSCAARTTATASASSSSPPPGPRRAGRPCPTPDSRRGRDGGGGRRAGAGVALLRRQPPVARRGRRRPVPPRGRRLPRPARRRGRAPHLPHRQGRRPARRSCSPCGGVDLTLVFPRPLPLVAANTRLRSGPRPPRRRPVRPRLALHRPVGRGRRAPACRSRRPRRAAREWMASEVSPPAHASSTSTCCTRAPETALPADGGRPAPGFLRHLEREDVLRLFAAFFPLPVDTRRAP